MFESIADKVVIRENKGFDIGAWQQGITEICGREELAKYDSLTLFNDSFFGPFYPFADIYKEMESRSKDYWGLSVRLGTVPLRLPPQIYTDLFHGI